MSNFYFEVKGQDEVASNLQRIPPVMTTHVMDAGQRAAWLLEDHIFIKTPKDTLEAAKSIVSDVRPIMESSVGAGIRVTVEGRAKHFPYLEYGTRPHYPPIAALEDWAARHGVNPYALQKSIGKRGTRAHYMVRQTYLEQRDKAAKIIMDAVKRVIARF